MAKQHELNRIFPLADMIVALTAFVLGSSAAPLIAQTAALPASGMKTLMQAPLSDPSEPKMVLSILNVAAGVTIPSHSHAGVVFAYVLQGDIENQVEPDPPIVYHPGGFFFERPKQVHRLLRNLSATEPAKILIFQNTSTDAPGALREESLGNITNQEVTVMTLVAAPGTTSVGAPHQHPGPVFAYVLKGEIENQVDPDPPKLYRAGDVFYEPPMHAHRMFRNLSKADPAELLIFEVSEKGQPLVIGVEK